MLIYNNFLPKQYQEELLQVMGGVQFPWNYQETTLSPKPSTRCVRVDPYKDSPYLHHLFFRDDRATVSPYFGLVKPILLFFEHKTGEKIKQTVRVVGNLLLPTTVSEIGIPHIDTDSNTGARLKTILYYINDIDGSTHIFNEKYTGDKLDNVSLSTTVVPEMGKCIVFDSDRFHSSSTPTLGRRMVINIIVEV